MSKKKMTLKEFAERYECCYSAAGVRLKKLIAKDKKFAKHVTYRKPFSQTDRKAII